MPPSDNSPSDDSPPRPSEEELYYGEAYENAVDDFLESEEAETANLGLARNPAGNPPPPTPLLVYDWIPEMYGTHRDSCGSTRKTEAKLRSTMKLWFAFCAQLQPARVPLDKVNKTGLMLYKSADFANGSLPNSECYDMATVDNFFNYLKDQGSTHSRMCGAKTFLNAHLRNEYFARLKQGGHPYPRVGNAFVGKSSVVRAAVVATNRKKADDDRKNYRDFHAHVEPDISRWEIRTLLLNALNGFPSLSICVLFIIQMVASFCSSAQICRRGEEHYKQRLRQRFCKILDKLGAGGTMCGWIVTNQAKHNQTGRVEFTAFAPHLDPLRDSSAWHGILWMYRLCVLHESMPAFTNYQEFMEVPTYRKLNSVEQLSDTQYGEIWEAMFKTVQGFMPSCLTHIWRGQGDREMNDAGCTLDDCSRMTGHKIATTNCSSSKQNSYLYNPPIPCTANRAGADCKKPETYVSPVFIVEVPDELLLQVPQFAKVLSNRAEAHSKFAEGASRKELEDKRLFMAKNSADSMVREIKMGFLMLASKPVDPATYLVCEDQPAIADTYLFGTLCGLLALPVFRSPMFTDLKHRVAESQMYHAGLRLHVPPPVSNAFQQHHVETVAPWMEQQRAHAYQTRLDLARLTELVQQLQQQGQHLSSACHGQYDGGGAAPVAPPTAMPHGHPQVVVSPPPLIRPLPAAQDTLKVSRQHPQPRNRERRRAISQNNRLRSEQPSLIPRPILRDSGPTLHHHWELYFGTWKPHEEQWGCRWRVDVRMNSVDAHGVETSKIATTRSTWWSLRAPMYDFFEQSLKASGEATPSVDGPAFQQAARVYNSVKGNTGKSPTIKVVCKAFKKALWEDFGIKRSKGRKAGSKNVSAKNSRTCTRAPEPVSTPRPNSALDLEPLPVRLEPVQPPLQPEEQQYAQHQQHGGQQQRGGQQQHQLLWQPPLQQQQQQHLMPYAPQYAWLPLLQQGHQPLNERQTHCLQRDYDFHQQQEHQRLWEQQHHHQQLTSPTG